MEQIWEAVYGAVSALVSIDRWPFFAVLAVFTIIGQFTSTRLFTRERAYGREPHWLWYWGRETLPLHPIATGSLLGLFWQDPEGAGWGWQASVAYFASAGVCSLFAWMLIKGKLKERGIDLKLPGSSVPPPVQPDDITSPMPSDTPIPAEARRPEGE